MCNKQMALNVYRRLAEIGNFHKANAVVFLSMVENNSPIRSTAIS